MSFGANILFTIFGLLAILSAVGTVMMRSPIRAAMALLTHIISLSILFLTLHAHLLAALQVLVYAGAVVVLFVFVIMLIGPSSPEEQTERGLMTKTVSLTLMGLITVALAATVVSLDPARPLIEACAPGVAECKQFGGVAAFSEALYLGAIVPFELIGMLLTVAVVGAVAVARGRTAKEAEEAAKLAAQRQAEADAEQARAERLSAEVSAHGGH